MFIVQALDLAAQATEHAQFKDWWWKVQLGKCYYRQVTRKYPHCSCSVFFWHLRMLHLYILSSDLYLWTLQAWLVSRGRKTISIRSQPPGSGGHISLPCKGSTLGWLHMTSFLHNLKNTPRPAFTYKWKIFSFFLQVYQRLDQPITALNLFKQGLDHFPGEVTLLTGIARIHEVHCFTMVQWLLSADNILLSQFSGSQF